ncbi:NAD-dependent epimerase/dehydratase family protein [Histidinibacterium aquaticum]|uniref:NAD-dependent epimerase/dehydratase family protein n=1 Tax=Histidinibacterium aquaticum TaxID=2613962 RepID=A0A5J5GAW9_9RHOB|nr:NAD-dependent epimerase/dehydratase family protein [Histidinibacterium aquaticum]KAA9005053.1 NAD-dependent epimerase/dehydratase family protein [Histidinibacterium aquaticum]
MKWLVTGGAGFVGSNLIASILSERPDDRVVVLDNFSASAYDEFASAPPLAQAERLAPDAPVWDANRTLGVIEGDIRDMETVERATAGADIVVHLAANTGVGPSVENPRLDSEMNIGGTLNMLEGARAAGVKRFVFASSGAPAGLTEPPITETIAPRPASPYGASKLAGEAYCCAYAVAFGVPTVALRFSNIYGPRSWRKGSVVATFIRQAMAGEPITVNGDGTQTRDFIHIDDLTRAIRLAATTSGLSGELYQVATGCETSVNQLLALLQEKFEAAGLPAIKRRQGERAAADVQRNFADASKAAQELGWRPQKDLSEGLAETLDWFLHYRRD